MAILRLNECRVDALKPRKSAFDIRDRELTGFGVRVLPSGGKRYFIHSQHRRRRVWKIVGEVRSIGVEEAQARARAMLASIRNGTDEQAAAPQDTLFEIVGDEVFRRYARNWKLSTLKVNRNYYRDHILPWFEGRPIADGFMARRLIGEWLSFYNVERPHSALDGRTPAEAYRGEAPVDMMDKPLRALPTSPQAQQQQQEDRFKGILAA